MFDVKLIQSYSTVDISKFHYSFLQFIKSLHLSYKVSSVQHLAALMNEAMKYVCYFTTRVRCHVYVKYYKIQVGGGDYSASNYLYLQFSQYTFVLCSCKRNLDCDL